MMIETQLDVRLFFSSSSSFCFIEIMCFFLPKLKMIPMQIFMHERLLATSSQWGLFSFVVYFAFIRVHFFSFKSFSAFFFGKICRFQSRYLFISFLLIRFMFFFFEIKKPLFPNLLSSHLLSLYNKHFFIHRFTDTSFLLTHHSWRCISFQKQL